MSKKTELNNFEDCLKIFRRWRLVPDVTFRVRLLLRRQGPDKTTGPVMHIYDGNDYERLVFHAARQLQHRQPEGDDDASVESPKVMRKRKTVKRKNSK